MEVELRKHLIAKIPHGDITRIAQLYGMNRQTIYNWRNGQHSRRVEEAILDYLEKIREEEEISRQRALELIK